MSTNPQNLRVGIISDSRKTYNDDEFYEFIKENEYIRSCTEKLLFGSNITKIEIERTSTIIRITIYSTTPDIIEKKCTEMVSIKDEIFKITNREIIIKTEKVVTAEDFINSFEFLSNNKSEYAMIHSSASKPFNGNDFYKRFCKRGKNKNRDW